MTNLDSILKSRDITLSTKVRLVKAFPVVMYGYDIWAVKKAERWRTDAFELWCWRKLFRVPWTSRISHQLILKEINPLCSLDGLMIKLKLQYFDHLIWRVKSLEMTLMLGTIEGRSRRGWQRMRWLDGITDSMAVSFSKLQKMVKDREGCHAAVRGLQRLERTEGLNKNNNCSTKQLGAMCKEWVWLYSNKTLYTTGCRADLVYGLQFANSNTRVL